MAEASEQPSFLSLRGSDSGLTLVNTDALIRKCDQQDRLIERKNKQITELEEKIEELQDKEVTYKEKLNEALDASEQSITSWTRNLVEENTSLKEQIEELLTKYRELKKECGVLNERLESTASGVNTVVRDDTEVYEEMSDGSRTLHADIGKENVIDVKDDDVIVGNETASHGGDPDVALSSRCNDAEKEEQGVKIAEDAAQDNSSSPFEARHDDSGEDSCTFKQSAIGQSGNGAEEMQTNASFVRSLVEENEELKRRMEVLCIENEELATECRLMSKGIAYKTNEVSLLEDRIRDLEDYFGLLQGQFGVLEDQDKFVVGYLSQDNCNKTPAFSNLSSMKRSLSANSKDTLIKSIAEEEVVAKDDGANEREEEGREGTENVVCEEKIGAIIEEEEECSFLDEDTLTDITLENTLTEEEFFVELDVLASDTVTQRTATPRKSIPDENENFSESEVSCHSDGTASEEGAAIGDDGIVKNDGVCRENVFMMEDIDAKMDKNTKEYCDKEQEREKKRVENKNQETMKKGKKEDVPMNDGSELKSRFLGEKESSYAKKERNVATVGNKTRRNDEGTHGMRNDKRRNAAIRSEDIKEEREQNPTQGNHSLTKFVEQVWSIIGGSRQIEDVNINESKVCCDNDQVAKVAHVIWELKEENSELYLKQYELKEVVEFLNTEVKLMKEEVNDAKKSREELEKEKDALANMCRELKDKCKGLQDENLNVSTTCHLLQEEHQIAECLVKDLEQKCFRKEEMFLKMEGEYINLQQEKSNLEFKAKEAVELEKKVNFWSRICGKLYSFLKKDNVEMAKVEERCETIGKLAKTERSRRKKIERKNRQLLKKDKIRSELLCGRAKLSSRMGEKMLDLQVEIERLHSEIINLKADRKGFEDSYKSAVSFSTQLRKEVAGLESEITLFKETLDRRTGQLTKVLVEKKLTSEELARVRKVKREHKKKMEELIKERRVIAMEVERQEGEIIEVKEKIKEKEMLLHTCRVELEKIIEKLKIEADNRHLLEQSVKEEKKIRTNVEQRLSEAIEQLSEAEGRLEEAMKTNEELENVIEAQQQQQELVKSEKKKGLFRRWFRGRKRKCQ